jgi:hypothetical protein
MSPVDTVAPRCNNALLQRHFGIMNSQSGRERFVTEFNRATGGSLWVRHQPLNTVRFAPP